MALVCFHVRGIQPRLGLCRQVLMEQFVCGVSPRDLHLMTEKIKEQESPERGRIQDCLNKDYFRREC